MSKLWVKAWRCDFCGYKWMVNIDGDPPPQCPSRVCRKRGWNTGKDYTVGQEEEKPTSNESREVVRVDPGGTSREISGAQDPLAAIRAKYGMKTASELGAGEAATPPPVTRVWASGPHGEDVVEEIKPRPWSPGRRDYYEPVRRGEWWEIVRDNKTGQVWALAGGSPRECKTVFEAEAYINSIEQ